MCTLWGDFGAKPARSGAGPRLRAAAFHHRGGFVWFGFCVFLFTVFFVVVVATEKWLGSLRWYVTNSFKKFLNSI